MMTVEPRWISLQTVVGIHVRQISEHGGLHGLREELYLQSSLDRPKHRYHYENLDIPSLAAVYLFGLIHNHPFVDGNKRTAYVVATVFLELHGYFWKTSVQERYKIILDIASGKLSEDECIFLVGTHIA